MAIQIQLRRDTTANWTSGNPTPASGEACFDINLKTLRIGDGVTQYLGLPVYQPIDSDLLTIAAANNGAVLAATTASFTTAMETKLSGIATGAQVNTVTSVNTKTGAVTLIADDIDDSLSTRKFVTAAQISKLAGIATGADVTGTANVTAAGALMDSEVDADLKTLSLPANTTISVFGASLTAAAAAVNARTTLGLGSAAVLNVDADLATFALPANTTISAFGATLVDDADAAAARTTLGLGTAATTASTAYATAAQGALAATAVQPGFLGDLGIKDLIAVPSDISATGTPSSTTFLRGDGVWSPIAGGGGGSASVEVSETQPVPLIADTLWIDPTDFTTYLIYDDGSTIVPVQIATPEGIVGPTGPIGPPGVIVDTVAPSPLTDYIDYLWVDTTDFTTYLIFDDGVDVGPVEIASAFGTGPEGPVGPAGPPGPPGTTDPASETVVGIVELATAAETTTGTDTTRATHPAGVKAAIDALKATVYGVVNHGAVAGTARPSGFAGIIWYGSVAPTNATGIDIVIRTDEAV